MSAKVNIKTEKSYIDVVFQQKKNLFSCTTANNSVLLHQYLLQIREI